MFWSKKKDWLPVSNAEANVKFWEEDLQFSLDYVAHLDKSTNKTYKGWIMMYKEALKDVAESQEGLYHARLKLEESKRLEAEGRTN